MNAPAEVLEERTGSCLCGRNRFTVRGPADFPHLCWCGHCQRLGGAPVMWWAGWPKDRITWTAGELTWYETFPGEAKRAFCGNCGTRVAAIDASEPNIGINVTALHDTTGQDLVPVAQSFRENAVSWLPVVTDTRHGSVG
ncbi:GFA family protein [Streptomyces sp. NPDC052101]|uniref:GFA family protein n=1 Tax=Streptomyces sp. NPDC052101 TaxID=3155763 RepID=UPI0034499EC8